MAKLVCWASGLLEVLPNKDVPAGVGPVVLHSGTIGAMRTLMTLHGEAREQRDGSTAWFVPGTKPIPTPHVPDSAEIAAIQRDNMTCVLDFAKKLVPEAAKRAPGRGFQ